MKRSHVYFIQAGDGGPIKIGSAFNIQERFTQLRTGNHEELRLLGAVVATRDMEMDLHRQFDAFRICGEWFHPVPQIMRLVESLPGDLVEELAPLLRHPRCIRCRRPLKLGPSGFCTVCNDVMQRVARL